MFLLFEVALWVLEAFTWLILVNIVMSWLMAFGVINYSNAIVYKIMRVIYSITEPVMNPVRNALPSLGGLDFSPIVVLLAIQGLQQGIVWLFYRLVA